jgi:hypothetical protein
MYSSTLSLTSAQMGVGGQRHAPAALLQGKRPGTHCTGSSVGPRAGLDGCENPGANRDSIPGPSISGGGVFESLHSAGAEMFFRKMRTKT